MKKSSFKFAAVVSAFAIAPILLPPESANAQPDGLAGSYIGITVDADKGLGLGQDFYSKQARLQVGYSTKR